MGQTRPLGTAPDVLTVSASGEEWRDRQHPLLVILKWLVDSTPLLFDELVQDMLLITDMLGDGCNLQWSDDTVDVIGRSFFPVQADNEQRRTYTARRLTARFGGAGYRVELGLCLAQDWNLTFLDLDLDLDLVETTAMLTS